MQDRAVRAVIRGCATVGCPNAKARRVNCVCAPPPRLCEPCTLAHRCPSLQNVDPKRWRAENTKEERFTTQVINALNLHPGWHFWRVDSGGARQRNGRQAEPGAADVHGCITAEPHAIPAYVETKRNHPDACTCDSCAAQRGWGSARENQGAIYVGNARTVHAAIDGVRLGIARARARISRPNPLLMDAPYTGT